jgi:hypothetical protein
MYIFYPANVKNTVFFMLAVEDLPSWDSTKPLNAAI